MAKLNDLIDAAVFVELLLKPRDNLIYGKCSSYVYKLTSERINGFITYGTLGEMWLAIRKKMPEKEQDSRLIKIQNLLGECNINITSPVMETYKIAIAIMNYDTRIKPSDALRLAEAKTLGFDRFITIDKEILENKRLQQEFGLKVAMPA